MSLLKQKKPRLPCVYYNIHDFHSNYDINECSSNDKSFSALNCNIRSLAANYDNFIHMLAGLNFPFTLMGLAETKIRVDGGPLINVDIPGYEFISVPSLSNAGGVAFCIKHDLNCSIRTDISTSNQSFLDRNKLFG
jgi:exonuclease III